MRARREETSGERGEEAGPPDGGGRRPMPVPGLSRCGHRAPAGDPPRGPWPPPRGRNAGGCRRESPGPRRRLGSCSRSRSLLRERNSRHESRPSIRSTGRTAQAGASLSAGRLPIGTSHHNPLIRKRKSVPYGTTWACDIGQQDGRGARRERAPTARPSVPGQGVQGQHPRHQRHLTRHALLLVDSFQMPAHVARLPARHRGDLMHRPACGRQPRRPPRLCRCTNSRRTTEVPASLRLDPAALRDPDPHRRVVRLERPPRGRGATASCTTARTPRGGPGHGRAGARRTLPLERPSG